MPIIFKDKSFILGMLCISRLEEHLNMISPF